MDNQQLHEKAGTRRKEDDKGNGSNRGYFKCRTIVLLTIALLPLIVSLYPIISSSEYFDEFLVKEVSMFDGIDEKELSDKTREVQEEQQKLQKGMLGAMFEGFRSMFTWADKNGRLIIITFIAKNILLHTGD